MPVSKTKLSRRLGVALTPKAARIMTKRAGPPGQRGRTRGRRGALSDYKRRLLEKQKLRAQYNIDERQMVNYFEEARSISTARKVPVTDALIGLLETRLDAVVMRGGLAPTIYAARQFVSHGHILVNGNRVDIPSYAVRPGDVISVKPESRDMPVIVDALNSAPPQSVPYLQLNKEEFTIKLLYVPKREDVPVLSEVPLVVEYYSR